MGENALAPQSNQTVLSASFSVAEMKGQVQMIQHLMKEVMKDGEHFGTIPGTPKPTLLKSGAEKLCFTFRLDPQYEVTEQYQEIGGVMHYRVLSKCTIYHIPTGSRLGSGFGSCTTREKKYAYRDAQRKCPDCGKEAIIKGKAEYGGGFLCFAKKGGCGAKFGDGDDRITMQQIGQVANPDLADQENTILKMANKRSLVAAVLNTTAASDIFTQDIEDMPEVQKADAKAQAPKTAKAQESQPIETDAEGMDAWKEQIYSCESVEQLESIRKEAQDQLDAAGVKFLKPHFETALSNLNKKTGSPTAKDNDRLEQIKAAFRDCETVKDLTAVMKNLKEHEKKLVSESFNKRMKELQAVTA